MGKKKATKKTTTASKKNSTDESKKKAFHARDHDLVPKHELLDEKQEQEVLDKLGVSSLELPNIFETDPAIQGLGAKPGHVIKITRASPTAGTSTFYRRVIHE